MCSGCTRPALGGSLPLCLPIGSHLGQSGKVAGLPVQENHFDCPRVAQHALLWGFRNHVEPNPSVPAQSVDSTMQPDSSQESVKPESPCLTPRATAIKEQGFSEAVAAQIEARQRVTTRSVYVAKWTIFTKWCHSNQVDFRAPPIKSIADVLLYVFQHRKLQSNTIDCHRSATINVSKDENFLDSFHRDRPKGRRGIPSWNLP